MARRSSSASMAVKPPNTDDLKLINGIGPGVESRLHGVGIYTFAQLAALSPADIAASVSGLAGLTTERIIKQDWIGQARKLALESALANLTAQMKGGLLQIYQGSCSNK
jgi:predicted flap endonuclease-1-like 5' DNA nuclease